MAEGIDYDADEYVYIQLANLLRRQITSGEIPPRKAIPSRVQLQQRYGVSGETVTKAIAVLAAEGFLKKMQGRGTFVRPESDWER